MERSRTGSGGDPLPAHDAADDARGCHRGAVRDSRAYLLAKASGAVRRRHAITAFRKDFYDLAFVTVYHRLGSSAELAEAVLAALPPPRDVDHIGDLLAALRELTDEDGAAVAAFVQEMGRSGADLDPDLLVQDCVSACLELLNRLRAATGR